MLCTKILPLPLIVLICFFHNIPVYLGKAIRRFTTYDPPSCSDRRSCLHCIGYPNVNTRLIKRTDIKRSALRDPAPAIIADAQFQHPHHAMFRCNCTGMSLRNSINRVPCLIFIILNHPDQLIYHIRSPSTFNDPARCDGIPDFYRVRYIDQNRQGGG